MTEKRQCKRCEYGVEPGWDTHGYFKNALIIKSIKIDMSYVGMGMHHRQVPLVAKEDFVLCDGCWNDFDDFMQVFTRIGAAAKEEVKTMMIIIDDGTD